MSYAEKAIRCLCKFSEARSLFYLSKSWCIEQIPHPWLRPFDQPATAEILWGACGKLVGIGSDFPSANALARIYIWLEVEPAASIALATTSQLRTSVDMLRLSKLCLQNLKLFEAVCGRGWHQCGFDINRGSVHIHLVCCYGALASRLVPLQASARGGGCEQRSLARSLAKVQKLFQHLAGMCCRCESWLSLSAPTIKAIPHFLRCFGSQVSGRCLWLFIALWLFRFGLFRNGWFEWVEVKGFDLC